MFERDEADSVLPDRSERPREPPFVCPACRQCLDDPGGSMVLCQSGHAFPLVGGIPRFVTGDLHESFGIQWNEFAEVQLDSLNGTDESRARLLAQSRRPPGFWASKRVLEAGCGAGRFTEILLEWGATVVGVDYSRAIEACARNNAEAIVDGRLHLAQADIFALPVQPDSFDVVLCYGVLQHTGDPGQALRSVWRCVRPGGILLADRYQTSLRCVLPLKYLSRPVLKRLKPRSLLSAVEALIRLLAPVERPLIRWSAQGGPLRQAVRLLLHRAPNSVYPFEVEQLGDLSHETALRWSVLDTFDQYAPRYDRPCTRWQWSSQLHRLPNALVEDAFDCGQGNTGIVVKT